MNNQTINFNGINITIENPVGSIRKGQDEQGNNWETKFFYPYGYIQNIDSTDGDELDCFIGPNSTSDKVFIIHQRRASGIFDENKVMLGFDSLDQARDAYLAHFNSQYYLSTITEIPFFEFKQRVNQELKSLWSTAKII